MDSNISKLFKFFSNWFIYLSGLIICGGLIYYLFNANQVIEIQSIKSFSDLYNIAAANLGVFFPALGAIILLIFLSFFIVPLTFKKLFKIHIIVPIVLIAGNFSGYYYGYGLYVFIANIVILVSTVFIITFTVLSSIPNNN